MTRKIQSKPQFMQSVAGDPEELQKNALSAIRNVLETEDHSKQAPEAKRDTAALARAEAEDDEAFRLRDRPKSERLQAAAPLADQEPIAAPKPGKMDLLLARMPRYRPTRRHILIAAAALLVLFRPWLVFWTLVFSVVVLVGTFLVLGADGFWQRVIDAGRWYTSRFPARAPHLHRKLDAFAVKWDMFLDHFPDGMVEGLYMPDFAELATAESRYDAVLDRRFANLREGKA